MKIYTALKTEERRVIVEQLRQKQDDRCLVCLKPLGTNAVLDHEHLTGRIRGLLHNRCNSSIGGFEVLCREGHFDRIMALLLP
jgi:hypothetical protein